jgi:aldehyde:ferredoxin oxidoreductase
MKAITVTVARFQPMYGWANRLLRVDLSTGRIWAHESALYLPDFIGARGVVAEV